MFCKLPANSSFCGQNAEIPRMRTSDYTNVPTLKKIQDLLLVYCTLQRGSKKYLHRGHIFLFLLLLLLAPTTTAP